METKKKNSGSQEKEPNRLINPYKELVQPGAFNNDTISRLLTAILIDWDTVEPV